MKLLAFSMCQSSGIIWARIQEKEEVQYMCLIARLDTPNL